MNNNVLTDLNHPARNFTDVITILDIDGKIVYESPSVNEMLGYAVSERIGVNIFEDSLVHPEDKSSEVDMLLGCLKTHNITKSEFRLRHRNNSWRFVEATCQVLNN